MAYEIANGVIPTGMLVRHTCDNPPCVNPKHLVLGTNADNMRDRLERTGYRRGEGHFAAKLTESDIAQMRDMRRNGASFQKIADRIGMSYGSVYSALHGLTWKHLPQEPDPIGRAPAERIPDAVIAEARRLFDEGRTWRVIERATGYSRGHLQRFLPHRTGYNPNPPTFTPEEAQEIVRMWYAGHSWVEISEHFGGRMSRGTLAQAKCVPFGWWRDAVAAVKPGARHTKPPVQRPVARPKGRPTDDERLTKDDIRLAWRLHKEGLTWREITLRLDGRASIAGLFAGWRNRTGYWPEVIAEG